ncbi:hypothetical protein I3842_07G094300 [Carya illinoinensis]|uniref:Chloroplast stem-loop binding protein of 41 kDa a, chloroplastic n=1 Tax=Carya illinoinensis TaxID=32201 RepID=A0A922EL54_CARIL|nr:hypothetical protein I3842_07G094300 [Carya illinoinensis]
MQSMATLASSSSLLLSSPPSNFSPPSLYSAPRLSLPSFSHSNALSSSLSISLPFLTYPTSSKRFAPSALSVRASATEKKKVLIVNTNSGGHAIIGFYFAKELLGSGHEVTILTVGEESSDKMKKPPFNRFSEIVSAGGRTVWGDPAEVGKVVGGVAFDVVLDNNGKDLDTVRPVIDWAKSSGVKQFLFISSAGIYKPTEEPPHVEGDVVKADAGHVGVEKFISEVFGIWSIFRPQYMIGSGNNKDCEEWFFDLTLDGMAKLCAQAAGCPVNIIHYDPKAVGIDAKKAFPFRNMHFYAEPRAAKDILGWRSTTNLPEDLKERFDEYVRIGRDKKSLKFEIDDKILQSLKVPVAV